MQATVVGNITDDPELRFTPSGAAVANFTVAENRRRFNRDRQEWDDLGTTFYRCAVWREAAENVAESLVRGMRVIAQGDVYAEEFERRDGSKGLSVNMNVFEIGPSIKYATARVTKNERRNSGGADASHGRPPANDPWASPAPSSPQGDPWGPPSGSHSDDPPF